jgi:hypothetical protein
MESSLNEQNLLLKTRQGALEQHPIAGENL